MSTEPTEKLKRDRKANARHADTVIAAIEERLACIVQDDQNEVHIRRLGELFEELRRAIANGVRQ